MFARLFTVVVSAAVLGLAGCAAHRITPAKQQLEVPEVIKAELVGKSLMDIPIYVNPQVEYYDFQLRKNVYSAFSTKLPEPPTVTAEAGKKFIVYFQKYLQENGFKTASSPCGSCLEIGVDFEYAESPTLFYILMATHVRARLAYNNQQLFETGTALSIPPKHSVWGAGYNDTVSLRLAGPIKEQVQEIWSSLFGGMATAAGK